jgi:hypothetical protein
MEFSVKPVEKAGADNTPEDYVYYEKLREIKSKEEWQGSDPARTKNDNRSGVLTLIEVSISNEEMAVTDFVDLRIVNILIKNNPEARLATCCR